LIPEFKEQGQSAELTVGGFAKVGRVEFLLQEIHHQNREDGLNKGPHFNFGKYRQISFVKWITAELENYFFK